MTIIVSATLAVVIMSQKRDNDVQWQQLLTAVIKEQDRVLSDKIGNQLSNVVVLGHVRSVIQAVSDPSALDTPGSPGDPTIRERVLGVFQSALTNYAYEQIMVISSAGTPVIQLPTTKRYEIPGISDLVSTVLATEKPQFIDVFTTREGSALIGYIGPVYDTSARPVGAVVALAQPTTTLFRYLDIAAPLTQTGEVMVLRQNGGTAGMEILYHTGTGAQHAGQPALLSLYQASIQNLSSPIKYITTTGTPREAMTQYLPVAGWTVVTSVQRSETRQALLRIAFIEIIATFSITITGLFINNFMAWKREQALLIQNAKKLAERNGETLRLNRLLKVTRAANQLISHETVTDSLLPGVCQELVETGGFLSAAIVHVEGTTVSLAAHAGKPFEGLSPGMPLPDLGGERMCMTRVLAEKKVIYISPASRDVCRTCSRLNRCPSAETLLVPITNGDSLYGVLVVRSQTANTIGGEERASIKELASDLAFAIRSQMIRDQKKVADEALRQSQKMEAVGQLAGGIAHDFNNLLTSIIGGIELVIDRPGQDAESVQTLKDARDAARRAADMTHNLLAFSRKTAVRTEVVDMDKVADQALGLLSHSLPPTIRIIRNRPAEVWSTQVDAQQMTQMLINLAINARDAMHDKGTLTISVSHQTLQEEEAAPEHRPGDYVMVAVQDTGEGMTPEVRSRIFEPFFTTKTPGHGTGLGLSMAYSAVEQAGGWFEVESEVGRGSTFRFLLPRCPEAPAAEKITTHTEPLPGGHETILLIDDEEPLRVLGQRILKRWGYTVMTAADGAEGIALFQKHQTTIDLVICDLTMPGMSGIECLSVLKRLRPEVPVLLSSGYSENTVIASLIEGANAASGFLAKPYTIQEMLFTIRGILDARGTGTTPRPEDTTPVTPPA